MYEDFQEGKLIEVIGVWFLRFYIYNQGFFGFRVIIYKVKFILNEFLVEED